MIITVVSNEGYKVTVIDTDFDNGEKRAVKALLFMRPWTEITRTDVVYDSVEIAKREFPLYT